MPDSSARRLAMVLLAAMAASGLAAETQTQPQGAKEAPALLPQHQTAKPVPPPAPKPEFELGKADSGKVRPAALGQVFAIRLPGNPTTGYQWQLAGISTPAVVSLGKPQYERTPTAKAMVGSGGTFVFTFKAAKPGKAAVKLVYVRPWEKDKPPAETFSVTIEVTARLAPVPAGDKPATGAAPSGPAAEAAKP